jgi:hypothetical protein
MADSHENARDCPSSHIHCHSLTSQHCGGQKTSRSIWEALDALYARTDILAQFDLRDSLSHAKLRDYQDLDRYLAEFKEAGLCFIAMSVTYTEFEMVHHITAGDEACFL